MKNSSKEILMLTEYFLPHTIGGSEWSVFHLANGLTSKNWKVGIFTPNYGSKKREVVKGISIYRFPFYVHFQTTNVVSPIHFSNLFWYVWTTLQLYFFCIKNRPRILHVQGKYFLPAAIIVGKCIKIPVLTTLRDYIPLCPHAFCITRHRNYQRCGFYYFLTYEIPYATAHYGDGSLRSNLRIVIGSINSWFTSKLLLLFLSLSTQTVAISHKAASIYKANGVHINNVIYNTHPFLSHTKESTYKENYLLYVGRATEGKGFSLLISAYEKYRKRTNSLPLYVVGVGNLLTKISTKRKDINYWSKRSYSETMSLMKNAKLMIVPSIWEEPFGRVALEAIAQGTPVLVTDRGALPEIIEHKNTGFVSAAKVEVFSEAIYEALKVQNILRKNIKAQYKSLKEKFEIIPLEEYSRLYEKYSNVSL